MVSMLLACTKTYKPEAPSEVYDNSGLDSLSNKVSYITVPIEIDISNIEKQINNNFSGLIYADSSFAGDDLKFKIWKKTDLSFEHRGNGIFDFRVPLKIWVEKRVKVLGMTQTPSTEFEILAKFSSKPFISSNWQLKTVTNAEGFEWISEPKLSIGGFSIPVAGLIGGMIENYQGSIARLIDTQVANEVDLVTPVLNAWNAIKEPSQLSEEYNLWLQIIPQDVLMTKLFFDKSVIRTSIAIKAFFNSSLGKSNVSVKKSLELPPLKFANQLPHGFGVHLYNLVTFSEAEKIAERMLLGQKFAFSGDREIEVLGVKIYGGVNNRLVIQIKTDGDLRGTIFLTGDPVYDKDRRQVVLKNTKFDVKTKNLVAKAASWLLEETVVSQIENKFGISVDPIFKEAKNSVNDYLNRKYNGLAVQGKITEIIPENVILKSQGLMTVVEAKGELAIKLTSFVLKK